MLEDVTVKVLLNSGVTEMFMNRKIAAKHRFRLQKLERPVIVKNVDSTNNNRGAIIYQAKVNIYYKNHIERIRDICNLGKMNIILGMLWLQAYNPKINQKMEEIKIIRYPPIYERSLAVKEDTEKRKKIGKRVKAVEKADRDR